MYFIALTIDLQPQSRHLFTMADSVYLHAAILTAITEVDAAIGHDLHDMQRNKSIAMALIESRPETTQVRLSFITRDALAYAHLLLRAFTRKSHIRIGCVLCNISAVVLNRGPWSDTCTWADMTCGEMGQRLHFWFHTPTAIAKRDNNRQRFFSLFPDPKDVFSGLARRWEALRGPSLPSDFSDFLSAGGCVTANHNLKTIEFKTPERKQIGFVGSVVYECRTSSQPHVDALHGLTRLAFFTGVGYQTARGMGLTRTLIAGGLH